METEKIEERERPKNMRSEPSIVPVIAICAFIVLAMLTVIYGRRIYDKNICQKIKKGENLDSALMDFSPIKNLEALQKFCEDRKIKFTQQEARNSFYSTIEQKGLIPSQYLQDLGMIKEE